MINNQILFLDILFPFVKIKYSVIQCFDVTILYELAAIKGSVKNVSLFITLP